MLDKHLFSVRMRASKNGSHEQGGKHISGGEMISAYCDLQQAIKILSEKALIHTRGKPDFMQIQLEAIHESITYINPLTITTNEVRTVEQGQKLAQELLLSAGVSHHSIESAYREMTEYSGIRGALVIDYQTGERLDERRDRGIRVSRMDWVEDNFAIWAAVNHISMNARLKEALALASKVTAHPATVAELCWSDDPEYVTGYVASKNFGYQRITKLKELGDEQGCRIFFVDRQREEDSYFHYLEKQPVFVHWKNE
ncbi:6-carboxyhexanoate--CoA ligase [Bacillus sp. DNRA2]|uniref:6-carboxyhexanoate--CoA ligase n=1 Tax=Bacillus sp. DNRA2 TaxID=2723053 RepID=UPI00145C5E10|nr:6-carboxyhexanoate--CoA ligase [Bacillus sp. DNRA2]NMD71722.1 6-carboxyhexanoate--CoA ligase [Bacillus sp. DNRA2]